MNSAHRKPLPGTRLDYFDAREAVEAIRGVEASLELPLSMQGSFRGAALAFEASLSNTLLLDRKSVV